MRIEALFQQLRAALGIRDEHGEGGAAEAGAQLLMKLDVAASSPSARILLKVLDVLLGNAKVEAMFQQPSPASAESTLHEPSLSGLGR
jgi:hypothetical protein